MTERGAAPAVPRDVMRRSFSSVLGLAAVAAALGCEQPPLGGRDVAADSVWVVSGLLFGLLLVFLVVELYDGLRSAWRRLRGLDAPPAPFQPGDTVHLSRAERRPLRRVRWRPRIARRTWNDVNPSADRDRER
jgi:hypothetical protein